MDRRIGFVHVPKTGGLSLSQHLSDKGIGWCGKHKSLDTLMHHPHDHFYITFVRNPLQTYISFYYFVTRHKINLYKHHTPQDMANMHLIWGENGGLKEDENPDLHVRGEPQVDLYEFLENCLPNQMFGYYYAPYGPEEIEFVGYTREMEKSYALLNKITDLDAPKEWININPNKDMNKSYRVDYPTMNKFIKRNELDYEMYFRGLERYEKLCKEYLT